MVQGQREPIRGPSRQGKWKGQKEQVGFAGPRTPTHMLCPILSSQPVRARAELLASTLEPQ